jgi:aminoglycoside phosphotransferase family enzyme
LLELISRVRKAETSEELVEMQSAADRMLRETLDCYDDGTVEESDLSVIALTLEQFHHAVTDRRVVLSAGGAGMPRMRAG